MLDFWISSLVWDTGSIFTLTFPEDVKCFTHYCMDSKTLYLLDLSLFFTQIKDIFFCLEMHNEQSFLELTLCWYRKFTYLPLFVLSHELSLLLVWPKLQSRKDPLANLLENTKTFFLLSSKAPCGIDCLFEPNLCSTLYCYILIHGWWS